MARKYNGGMEVGTGFDVQSNRPLDERDIVQTQIDLLVLENCYPGIEVKVEDESYVAYKWNGIDQTNIANWTIQTSGGGGTGDGDMLKSDYAFDNNTVKDSNQLNGQEASAYMTKTVYDSNDNGIVDNSEQLGGENPGYYDQGQALTDHVDNTDVHLSTDERAAIDNSPNVPNAGNAFATQADLASGGNGDMLISVYGGSDANTVRNSDAVDGLTGAEVDQRAHVADVTTNPHAVTKANVSLGNVDNTSDAAKPISTDTQAALDTKLEGIEAGTGITVDVTNPLIPKLSTEPTTTAGVISRYYYSGDQETTTEGTFYTTALDGGTVANASQTETVLNGQKLWYPIDTLGGLTPADSFINAGTYAGQLSIRVDSDKDANRWTIEVYLCDAQGAPTPSGIAGAPIGDLGVQVITILDTALEEFKKDEYTQITFSGPVLANATILQNQRVRYHIACENVGTSGNPNVMTMYMGTDHLSYIDAPTAVTSDGVRNTSTVTGATQTDVNNTIPNKANLSNGNVWSGNQTHQVDDKIIFDYNVSADIEVYVSNDAPGNAPILYFYDTSNGEGFQFTWGGAPFLTFAEGSRTSGIGYRSGDGVFEIKVDEISLDITLSDGAYYIKPSDLSEHDYFAPTKPWVRANTVQSNVTGEPSGSDRVVNMVSCTQLEYDAGTPNADTFYVITG